MEAEEREREAKQPRHQDLTLVDIAEELGDEEQSKLRAEFGQILRSKNPRRVASQDAHTFDDDSTDQGAREVADLKKRLGKMKVVARAKVCQDRIYSAAYHPEPTKDLIFFGGECSH